MKLFVVCNAQVRCSRTANTDSAVYSFWAEHTHTHSHTGPSAFGCCCHKISHSKQVMSYLYFFRFVFCFTWLLTTHSLKAYIRSVRLSWIRRISRVECVMYFSASLCCMFVELSTMVDFLRFLARHYLTLHLALVCVCVCATKRLQNMQIVISNEYARRIQSEHIFAPSKIAQQ